MALKEEAVLEIVEAVEDLVETEAESYRDDFGKERHNITKVTDYEKAAAAVTRILERENVFVIK